MSQNSEILAVAHTYLHLLSKSYQKSQITSCSFATCIQESTSQGDIRFGESAGKQCCAIA